MSQFIDVVGFILRENRNKDLFAMSAWSIWYRRNAMRQNQQVVPVNLVCAVKKENFEEYQRYNSTNKPSIRAAWILQNKLQRSYIEDTNDAGIGVVSNHDGLIMAAQV